jgi:hypothetical protein
MKLEPLRKRSSIQASYRGVIPTKVHARIAAIFPPDFAHGVKPIATLAAWLGWLGKQNSILDANKVKRIHFIRNRTVA